MDAPGGSRASNGWLYALAALMALSFASKEVTFITVAIAIAFIDIMLAVELGRRREDEQTTGLMVLVRTLAMIPVAWLIAASWPLIGQRPFGRQRRLAGRPGSPSHRSRSRPDER